MVVYSSAIRLDNPELQAAERHRIPMVRRALLLAAILHRQRGICVAGMHGKTTTSALLAFALDQLGLQPSYAIGALVPPTYAEEWAARHPRLLASLDRWERRLEALAPMPSLADHYLLELERVS